MLLGTRAMWGGRGTPYLESVGGAWINTGLPATLSVYNVDITFKLLTNKSNNIAISGWWYINGKASRVYWRGASNCFYYQHPTNTATPFSKTHTFNGLHTMRIGNGFVALDDEKITTVEHGAWEISNSSQPLFGAKSFSRASDTGSTHELLSTNDIVRVYSAEWSPLLASREPLKLLPAKDPSGTPCMKDEVSGKYFYNQGPGHFNFGISQENL